MSIKHTLGKVHLKINIKIFILILPASQNGDVLKAARVNKELISKKNVLGRDDIRPRRYNYIIQTNSRRNFYVYILKV